MNQQQRIGLLGGSFDPIHNGHLHVAQTIIALANLNHVQLIPTKHSVHRITHATSADRQAMVERAIQDYPLLRLNTIELERGGPSYTIDTLRALANPHHLHYFIIGADNFLHFNTWHEWQNILSYCHLLIVNRPGFDKPIPHSLKKFYEKHFATNICHSTQPTGCIYSVQISPSPISATHIRNAIAKGRTLKNELPACVYRYIKQHELYSTP